jgi:crotonobetainyl-CoA:carnitine CoA-transferase CaiB-like acyl-CoA transferase
LMSITGAADGPPFRLGVAIADIASGMFAAQGVTLALLVRERTGHGQAVDVAMLDSAAALLTYQAAIYFATGCAPHRMGNRHPTIAPYDTFAAADGEFMLAVGTDDQWRAFCGVAEIDHDERFATNRQRVVGYDELEPIIAARLRQGTRQHWIDRLKAVAVPCGLVRDIHEALADPQLAAREMIANVKHQAIGSLRLLGVPIKLSASPGAVASAPPMLGEHTDAVLHEVLGLSHDHIRALRVQGVV